jgi:iron complex outermembrane receptor protein
MNASLVVGADWGNWRFDRRFAADPGSISVPTATTLASQGNNAFYAQYNAQVTDATKLTFGWRSQRVSDHLIQTGFAISDQNHIRTPRAGEAGIQYELSSSWTAFGRLATSCVATVDENGFTATGNLLEPQTARHREAGVEYRQSGFRLRTNLYTIDLNNEIYFSPIVVPFGANTNLSPTRRGGVELFAALPVSKQLEFSGNAIVQTAKFKTGVYGGIDVSGKDIPLVPRELVNLRSTWLLMPQTRLVAAVSYVGKQRYDNDQANTFSRLMPTYLLADLKLSCGR